MILRIIILFLLCGHATMAQELVVNGSFEHENICTEYTQTCSPIGWRNTAHLPFGYQRQTVKPPEGIHYLPMVVEDVGVSNFRTYWQTRLKCPMQKGAVYKISFYAGALGAKFIPGNLGIHFSAVEVNQLKVWPIKVQPSVKVAPRNIISVRRSEWLKVDLEYTANGDEQFLVVGNFLFDDEMTKHRKPQLQKVTYCIDELSVKKADEADSCQPKPEVLEWLAARARHTPVSYQNTVVKKQPPPVVGKPQEVRIDTLVLQDVLFKFDSESLTSGAEQVLDTIVARLRQKPYKRIRVEGHTDSLGTDAYNLNLSGRRANSVMMYFIGKGVNDKLIGAKGKGELHPVSTNGSDEGRRKNRRVEILIEY